MDRSVRFQTTLVAHVGCMRCALRTPLQNPIRTAIAVLSCMLTSWQQRMRVT